VIHEGAHGNSDLSAHFFRRGAALIGEHGALGLIATNSIAQGDTRTTGLRALVDRGWGIFDATGSMPWPGAAAVSVSLVHAGRGRARGRVPLLLDGFAVPALNSQLQAKPERADPAQLGVNAAICFQGNMINGRGFVLTPEERDAYVRSSASNEQVVFPYLGGEEVNTSPRQAFDRYVINFGERTLEEASAWPELLARVRELVKSERDQIRDNTGKGAHAKKYWWQFVDRCDPLMAALHPLPRALVTANVTKHLVFAWQPSGRVLSNALRVFALARATQFAVLQSRVHEPWVRLLSSSMRTDLRYSASDCFETFPFPRPDPRTVIAELEAIGEQLYETRAAFMVETNQGLTKTYNALKDTACDDPRVLLLRRLHEDMDRAVLAAYGWTDIAVPPFCPLTDADRAALQAFEDEMIDRLYVLNAERAAEEERLGLGAKGPNGPKGKASAMGLTDADSDAMPAREGEPAVPSSRSAGPNRSTKSAKPAKPAATSKKKPGSSQGQGDLF